MGKPKGTIGSRTGFTTVTPDYGIDAPGVRRVMLIAGTVGLLLAVLACMASLLLPGIPAVAWMVPCSLGALATAYGYFMGCYMTWGSRYGKLKTRDALLDRVGALRPWTGSEDVLDVGCGRGLMLVGAARRLDRGQATGIDLWRAEDQSDNAPTAAIENARLEGVGSHIRVDTGDARELPYADGSFDVVLSHWVVHNLPTPEDRQRVLREMMRVLKPGGVVAVADIQHVPVYCEQFHLLGATEVQFLDGGAEARLMAFMSGGSYCPQALLARRRAMPGGEQGLVA